ncbi:MAG: hypothetical protein R6U35_06560 [Candidatus Humimicrobiaceae bacterium]
MDLIKNFFSAENIERLFNKFYLWLEGLLQNWFKDITYEPIRELLTNPWFWIIILILFFLAFIFRRR